MSNEQNENQSLAMEYDSTNLWHTVKENMFYDTLSGMIYHRVSLKSLTVFKTE